MSETTNELHPSEVAYNLAKARKVTAEAQSAEYLAEGHFYGIEEARRNALQLTISNDHLRVLRFSAAVTPGAVDTAIARLTKWHREDNLGDVRLPIEIIFTSPGGSIIDGLRLYDFIQEIRHAGHHVTTGTYGMAASMAGVLLQAGDVRYASGNAWLMIHRASFGAQGSMDTMEDEVALVTRMEGRLLDILDHRSNITRKTIMTNWKRKDWWLTPEEALKAGFIDEIRGVLR